MLRPLIAFGLVVVPVMLVSLSCGGGPAPNILQPTMGSVTLLAGDAPACDIISAPVTITSATLTPQSGGSPVSLIVSSSPVTLDFASLADLLTLLTQMRVPTGTYSQLTVQVTISRLVVINTTVTPPAPATISVPSSTATLTFSLNPALVVSATAPGVAQIDFNLLQSVQVSSTGQLTGAVNPAVQVSLPASGVTAGFGEMEDLSGIVQSVNSSAGTFTLPMPGIPTESLTIQISNATLFDNAGGLGGLVPGKSFVEVSAILDSSGDVLATEVDAEAEDDPSLNEAAFEGVVTSVTRNSSGSPTQLTLYVRQAQPPLSDVAVPGQVTFNITSNTTLGLFPIRLNPGNIPFGLSNLGPGQEVVVHAQMLTANPLTLDANAIFLHLQSVLGSFSATPAPVIGTDNLTGGFSFTPCSTLLDSNPMTVFTFFTTVFPGVAGNGLSGLPASSQLMVQGLVFYEPHTVALNGMTSVAPGVAEEASEVRQIP